MNTVTSLANAVPQVTQEEVLAVLAAQGGDPSEDDVLRVMQRIENQPLREDLPRAHALRVLIESKPANRRRMVIVANFDDPENEIVQLDAAATWVQSALSRESANVEVLAYASAELASLDEKARTGAFEDESTALTASPVTLPVAPAERVASAEDGAYLLEVTVGGYAGRDVVAQLLPAFEAGTAGSFYVDKLGEQHHRVTFERYVGEDSEYVLRHLDAAGREALLTGRALSLEHGLDAAELGADTMRAITAAAATQLALEIDLHSETALGEQVVARLRTGAVRLIGASILADALRELQAQGALDKPGAMNPLGAHRAPEMSRYGAPIVAYVGIGHHEYPVFIATRDGHPVFAAQDHDTSYEIRGDASVSDRVTALKGEYGERAVRASPTSLAELYARFDALADVPVVEDEGEARLDTDFLHFSKGTERDHVWRWFERAHPQFVVGEVLAGQRRHDVAAVEGGEQARLQGAVREPLAGHRVEAHRKVGVLRGDVVSIAIQPVTSAVPALAQTLADALDSFDANRSVERSRDLVSRYRAFGEAVASDTDTLRRAIAGHARTLLGGYVETYPDALIQAAPRALRTTLADVAQLLDTNYASVERLPVIATRYGRDAQSGAHDVRRAVWAEATELLQGYDTAARQAPRPAFDAQALLSDTRNVSARSATQQLQAWVGQRALAGEPVFDRSDTTYRLRGWMHHGQTEAHVTVSIRPEEHRVDIDVESGKNVLSTRLTVPGEIVGLTPGEGYSAVYFSLERGERRGNLFDLVSVLGAAVDRSVSIAIDRDVAAKALATRDPGGPLQLARREEVKHSTSSDLEP